MYIVVNNSMEGMSIVYLTTDLDEAKSIIYNYRNSVLSAKERLLDIFRKYMLDEQGVVINDIEDFDERVDLSFNELEYVVNSGLMSFGDFMLAKYEQPSSYCLKLWDDSEKTVRCVCHENKLK